MSIEWHSANSRNKLPNACINQSGRTWPGCCYISETAEAMGVHEISREIHEEGVSIAQELNILIEAVLRKSF